MLALFLTGIPIVGFIYVLVVAFGGSASPSRCNWARAMLLWQIIAIILVVVFIALGRALSTSLEQGSQCEP